MEKRKWKVAGAPERAKVDGRIGIAPELKSLPDHMLQ